MIHRRVRCEVSEGTSDGDHGQDVPSVNVCCSRCGTSAQAFGTSEASIRYALLSLRKSCPRGERNFYAAKEE